MHLECPGCSREIGPEWIICAFCGLPLEGEDEVHTVEDQIKAWRSKANTTTARSAVSHSEPQQGIKDPTGLLNAMRHDRFVGAA